MEANIISCAIILEIWEILFMVRTMAESSSPLVSIVILNFNGKGYLDNCLSSVLQTKHSSFEVVFVDNGSTDSSADYVKEKFGNDRRLRIIRLVGNRGITAGYNLGFAHSKGKYIALMNNDIIVDPDWLTNLLDALIKDKTVGIAASLLLEFDGTVVQSAGKLLGNFLLYQFEIGRGLPGNTKFLPTFEVSFGSGAAMILERDLIKEIGLYDPEISYYYDDNMLALKTWLAGKRVITVSKSIIRHKTSGAPGWNNDLSSFRWSASRICLILDVYRNYNGLAEAFLIFAISEIFHMMVLAKNRNLQKLFSYIKVLNWLLRNFKHIWCNRINHWSKAKITPEMLESKFIRVNLPSSVYLQRGWNTQCEKRAQEYQRSVILSTKTEKTRG
jgi:GT2 family glycosyltransferase